MNVEWILMQRLTDLVDCLHTLHVIISTKNQRNMYTEIYIYIC